MPAEAELLVLGAGVTGLAAGSALGRRALVLEAEDRPGGLVRTECFGGYWFDRVLHLLHLADPAMEAMLRRLLGPNLAPCAPVAWVECDGGVARYPIQLNLGALREDRRRACLEGLAAARERAPAPEQTLGRFLLDVFGEGLCETFFFPYHRKLWRRPLDSMVARGQSWNVRRPTMDEVLDGVRAPNQAREAYNTHAYYPRPEAGAPQRGMEVLARALARRVRRLWLRTRVLAVDPDRRQVTALRDGRRMTIRYRERCLSTLPLPATLRMCRGAPASLVLAAARLPHIRVLSLAYALRGPRPPAPGHWRYYTDERLLFTRLIFMTEFDPLAAPADGWSVMAEVTQPAEQPVPDEQTLLARGWEDVQRTGILPPGTERVDARVMRADPAYVVFTPEAEQVAAECREYLAERGIDALGRYGRWEYSSMAQVMKDGLGWAARFAPEPA